MAQRRALEAWDSHERVVFASELASFARGLLDGVTIDADNLQLADICAVGPGGSFLGRSYTRRHYRDVWQSPLVDTSLYNQWAAEGRRTLADRLRERTHELITTRAPAVSAESAAEITRLAAWTDQ